MSPRMTVFLIACPHSAKPDNLVKAIETGIVPAIDTHPNLNVFSKQCDKRIAFYKKSNHEIHTYHMDGTKTKIEKRKPRKKKELHEINICLIED